MPVPAVAPALVGCGSLQARTLLARRWMRCCGTTDLGSGCLSVWTQGPPGAGAGGCGGRHWRTGPMSPPHRRRPVLAGWRRGLRALAKGGAMVGEGGGRKAGRRPGLCGGCTQFLRRRRRLGRWRPTSLRLSRASTPGCSGGARPVTRPVMRPVITYVAANAANACMCWTQGRPRCSSCLCLYMYVHTHTHTHPHTQQAKQPPQPGPMQYTRATRESTTIEPILVRIIGSDPDMRTRLARALVKCPCTPPPPPPAAASPNELAPRLVPAVSHDSVTVTAALTNTMASAGVSLASLPVRIDTAGTDAQKF